MSRRWGLFPRPDRARCHHCRSSRLRFFHAPPLALARGRALGHPQRHVRPVQLAVPRLVRRESAGMAAAPGLQSLELVVVPRAVGGRVAPQGVPVVAEGQVLGADGHGARVAPSRGRGELVLAVLVVIAEDGAVFLFDEEEAVAVGEGRGGERGGLGEGGDWLGGEGGGDGLEALWPAAEGVVVEGADEEEGGVVDGGLLLVVVVLVVHFVGVGVIHCVLDEGG